MEILFVGGKIVYNALLTALVIVSVLLIILVIMQPSKSNAASTLSGGNTENLQGRQKARGFEAFLIRATTVLGIAFFVLSLVLAYLSSNS